MFVSTSSVAWLPTQRLHRLSYLAGDTKCVTQLGLATSELAIHFSNGASLNATCKDAAAAMP